MPRFNTLNVRLAIVGSPAAGKSSLVRKFTNSKLTPFYIPTIGVHSTKQSVKFKNALIKSQLWDLAGQELFRAASSLYTKNADGIIVVFDLSNKESYVKSYNWCLKILESKKNACLVIVGNKKDLVIDVKKAMEKVKELFVNIRVDGFFTTSAKTGDGVDEMFYEVIALSVINKLNLEKKSSEFKNNNNLYNRGVVSIGLSR